MEIKDKKGSENHVADRLSRLANEAITAKEAKVVDELPDEKLLVVHERPWFADMANFKAAHIVPENMDWQHKKKLFKEAKQYIWDDFYLFKIGADNLLRRRVTNREAQSILWHCHNSPYGGHFNGDALQQKCYNLGFIGQHCSKMLTHMCNIVISVKGQGTSLGGMRCLCRTFRRLRCLIVGELTLWDHYPAHCLMSIS